MTQILLLTYFAYNLFRAGGVFDYESRRNVHDKPVVLTAIYIFLGLVLDIAYLINCGINKLRGK